MIEVFRAVVLTFHSEAGLYQWGPRNKWEARGFFCGIVYWISCIVERWYASFQAQNSVTNESPAVFMLYLLCVHNSVAIQLYRATVPPPTLKSIQVCICPYPGFHSTYSCIVHTFTLYNSVEQDTDWQLLHNLNFTDWASSIRILCGRH